MREWLYNHYEKFFNTLVSFLRLFLFTKFYVRVKNIKPSNNCLILANGPSLNDLIKNNKQFLADKDLFCVNYFPTTNYFEELKPKYFVTSAPEFWLTHLNENFKNETKIVFSAIGNKTKWDLTLFIPYEAKNSEYWKSFVINNKHIKINYYNITPIEGYYWFRKICYRYQWGMPRVHNVLIPTIMLAIKLGYKNIYLWGTDHSWLKDISVDEDNNVLVCHKHFYDYDISKPQKMRKLKGTRKMHEVLYKFMQSFKAYHEIEEYARKNNINIFNATPGSYIDAFRRLKM
ncbi:MAG: hypothetical protein N3A01_02590 [Bacteroidales bacterium]|nr:hypothetical protein [Bacteroidales bacterium]